MRLVDEDARAVTLGHVHDLGQDADVAVHRVDAFHHHQLLPAHPAQLAFQVHGVVVAEEDGLGLGQDGPVHDRRVRVLIAEDVVARAHDGGDEADVRAVPGREQDGRFLVLELGHGLGQLHVDVEGAGEDRRTGGAEAVPLQGLYRRLLDFRPVRNAQIVVRSQVDELAHLARLAVADADLRRGRRFEWLGIEVVAVRPRLAVPLVERGQQVEGIVAGPVIEIAVVVVAEHGFARFLLVRGLHVSLSAHAGLSDPLRGGTAV